MELTPAVVTRVETVGTGDRVCVDCASAFHPGEGLLVGSFATGLFLVHSECLDAEGYVNSRPFRVNAGALCSYVVTPGGKTAYLSELRAGDDVTCVNEDGHTRVMTVGRAKVEQRQMVLVEAECGEKSSPRCYKTLRRFGWSRRPGRIRGRCRCRPWMSGTGYWCTCRRVRGTRG